VSWAQVTLSVPPSLQAVIDGLQGCRDAAAGELDTSLTRLGDIAGELSITPNPVAAVASGAESLRVAMDGLLQRGGRFVCAHPYIHPLGDRRGDYAYLTPQQAVEGLADKLADPNDLIEGDALRGVLLLLRGVDHAGLAEALAAFNAIFPVTELQLAERRARWLSSLEKDKLVQTTGSIHPSWASMDTRRHPGGASMDKAAGGLLGMADGYALENQRPEDELASVIEKKRAFLQGLEAAWETIAAGIQGGGGLGVILDGNVSSIHRQLTEALPPVEGYKLAVACCWIGNTEDMTIFKELFGL